jgi:hypothetical protein
LWKVSFRIFELAATVIPVTAICWLPFITTNALANGTVVDRKFVSVNVRATIVPLGAVFSTVAEAITGAI